MSNKLKLRVIQLDLARQIENLEYIKGFIDFAVANEYNALGLYLEGRIRTKSFPYPAKTDSYSLDEMQELVKYAGQKGMEVIPMLSLLGHVEQFLKYKEMEHLAELRENIKGRLSNKKCVFCPSLKETYLFIEKYISEIVDFFPSEYLHAGCDEAWDIGICDVCGNRADGQSGIFASHLNDLHKIIVGKYKKKMIIWDDLFENYPDTLHAIPKDIIMCTWHYDNLVDIPRAHFNNRLKIDKFAEYDKLGFKYFLAPAANYSYRNTETFTKYAQKYKPVGGWMTVWELNNTFLHKAYPIIAYAGRLWAGEKDKNLFENVAAEIFGIKDVKFIKAVKAVYTSGLLIHMQKNFFAGALTEEETIKNTFMESIFETIKYYASKDLNQFQLDIIEDLLIGIEIDIQSGKLREVLPALVDPQQTKTGKNALIEAGLEPVIKKLREIKKRRKQQWNRHRKGIKPCNTDQYFDNVIKNISEFKKNEDKGILNVHLFLPEFHSAQTTAFYIKYKENKNWKKVAEGVYKQLPCKNAFYTCSFLIPQSKTPEAVRIETRGYGGQGVTFLEVKNKRETFIPSSITNIRGIVEKADYILDNDDKWCFMGEKDTQKGFLSPVLANSIHAMDVYLKNS